MNPGANFILTIGGIILVLSIIAPIPFLVGLLIIGLGFICDV